MPAVEDGMRNDEDMADGEDIRLLEDDVVDKEDFIPEDKAESGNEDVVANKSDVADEEDKTFVEGYILDMEDTIVDGKDDAKAEDIVFAKDDVDDMADETEIMVDEGLGVIPHADESLIALILCQLPLWSIQS